MTVGREEVYRAIKASQRYQHDGYDRLAAWTMAHAPTRWHHDATHGARQRLAEEIETLETLDNPREEILRKAQSMHEALITLAERAEETRRLAPEGDWRQLALNARGLAAATLKLVEVFQYRLAGGHEAEPTEKDRQEVKRLTRVMRERARQTLGHGMHTASRRELDEQWTRPPMEAAPEPRIEGVIAGARVWATDQTLWAAGLALATEEWLEGHIAQTCERETRETLMHIREHPARAERVLGKGSQDDEFVNMMLDHMEHVSGILNGVCEALRHKPQDSAEGRIYNEAADALQHIDERLMGMLFEYGDEFSPMFSYLSDIMAPVSPPDVETYLGCCHLIACLSRTEERRRKSSRGG